MKFYIRNYVTQISEKIMQIKETLTNSKVVAHCGSTGRKQTDEVTKCFISFYETRGVIMNSVDYVMEI